MSDAVGTVVEYKQTSQRQTINQKKEEKRERESKPRKLLGQFICRAPALVILVVSAIVFF
jgi:hypothetical protein